MVLLPTLQHRNTTMYIIERHAYKSVWRARMLHLLELCGAGVSCSL